MEKAASLPEDSQLNAFSGLTEDSARSNDSRESRFTFLRSQPEGKSRRWAYGNLLQNWIDAEGFDPAAAWIEANQDKHSPLEIAFFEQKLAFSNVGSNPKQTIDWLLERSGPERRAEDIEALVFGWSISEPNAAGEWLASQELGPDTDKAVARFAINIQRDDPESAWEWAQRITNQNKRAHVLRMIGSSRDEAPPVSVD